MKVNLLTLSLFAVISASLFSCKKDKDNIPSYTVPDTYNFTNVEYKESAARISMWNGFQGILGRSASRQLSQDTINNLWNNTGNAFTAETASGIPYTYDVLNTLPFNLAGKSAEPAVIKAYADSMVRSANSLIHPLPVVSPVRSAPPACSTTADWNSTRPYPKG